jgi:hypothetical protein
MEEKRIQDETDQVENRESFDYTVERTRKKEKKIEEENK